MAETVIGDRSKRSQETSHIGPYVSLWRLWVFKWEMDAFGGGDGGALTLNGSREIMPRFKFDVSHWVLIENRLTGTR